MKWEQQFMKPSEDTPWSAFGHVDDISYKTPPKMFSEGEWLLLEKGNDWGFEYWTLPDEGLDLYGASQKSLGRDLEGRLFSVRWPGGAITKSYIGMDLIENYSGDWPGQACPIYWVGVNIHGIGIKVNIKDLQFDRAEIEAVPIVGEPRDE